VSSSKSNILVVRNPCCKNEEWIIEDIKDEFITYQYHISFVDPSNCQEFIKTNEYFDFVFLLHPNFFLILKFCKLKAVGKIIVVGSDFSWYTICNKKLYNLFRDIVKECFFMCYVVLRAGKTFLFRFLKKYRF